MSLGEGPGKTIRSSTKFEYLKFQDYFEGGGYNYWTQIAIEKLFAFNNDYLSVMTYMIVAVWIII